MELTNSFQTRARIQAAYLEWLYHGSSHTSSAQTGAVQLGKGIKPCPTGSRGVSERFSNWVSNDPDSSMPAALEFEAVIPEIWASPRLLELFYWLGLE